MRQWLRRPCGMLLSQPCRTSILRSVRSLTMKAAPMEASAAMPPLGTAAAIPKPSQAPASFDIYRPGLFDTHKLQTRLEQSFSRPQAEILTKAIAHHLRVRYALLLVSFWSTHPRGRSQQLDEEIVTQTSYAITRILYDAELKSVRNELRLQEKSEFLGVKSELSQLEREIVTVDQAIKEALTTLRTNMNIELNTMKIVMRDDHKRHERGIAETNFKLQAELSELKTEIEVSKLDIIKYSVGALFASLFDSVSPLL